MKRILIFCFFVCYSFSLSAQVSWNDSMIYFKIIELDDNPFIDANSLVTVWVQGKNNVSKLCHDTATSFALTVSNSGKTKGFKAPKELSYKSLRINKGTSNNGVTLNNVRIVDTKRKGNSTMLLMQCGG